jgi:putative flippase GtrA
VNRRNCAWIKFNTVGLIGVVVQIVVLQGLTTIGLHYMFCTAIAVEVAILHNFVWHERWTWIDRAKAAPAESRRRLLRFHLTNGSTSICGNLVLMSLFVTVFRMPYMLSNLFAIAICSLANFWTGEHIVFRLEPGER